MKPTPHTLPQSNERGAALILVTVITVITLMGGLAIVAVTSGAISSAAGFRSKSSVDACADAALEKMRSLAPDSSSANSMNSTFGGNLTYRAGHYTGTGATATGMEVLSESSYDSSAIMGGERITNVLAGENSGGLSGVRVLSVRATCSGSGMGEREMETVFRFGIPIQ